MAILAAICLVAIVGLFASSDRMIFGGKAYAEQWSECELEDHYEVGSTVEIPSLTVTVGGETVTATFTVIYPDKTAVDTKTVTLAQAGIYTVEYCATAGGKHYSTKKQFEATALSFMTEDKNSSTRYGVYPDYDCTTAGLITYLAQGDTLTFSQLIDVDDLTRGTPFFSAYIVPERRGEADFDKFVVTLTDALDSSVYLRYEINRYTLSTLSGKGTLFVSAGGNGQDQVGHEWAANKFHVNDGLGTSVAGTFIAQRHAGGAWAGTVEDIAPDSAGTISLAYDRANNAAIVGNVVIAEMGNPDDYGTLWDGFRSGKVRLSVSADRYSNSLARFVVTNAMGSDLTTDVYGKAKPFHDTEKPVLTIDADELPLGQVNSDYRIPSASAFDWYSGVCEVKTSVYYDYETETPSFVTITNGTFNPKLAGNYVIEYTATDNSGNVAKEIRNVVVRNSVPEMKINVVGEIARAELGEHVKVGVATVTGGSGTPTVRTYVSFGDETYEIDGEFLPEKRGIWTVRYVATDYVGNTTTYSYEVDCYAGNKPKFLENPTLPRIFINDCGYTLPELYVREYASGEAEKKLAKVEITDLGGTKVYDAGTIYKVNGQDKVTVRYYYGEATLETVEIPVVSVKDNGRLNVSNYLYGNMNVTSEATAELREEMSESVGSLGSSYYFTNGLLVTAKEAGKAEWTFANKLSSSAAGVSFTTIPSKTAFTKMAVKFIDSESGGSVTLKIIGGGNKTLLVLGDTTITLSGSLGSKKTFNVNLRNDKILIDASEIAIKNTDDGKGFNGFSDGVYLSVSIEDAAIGSGYLVTSVADTVLSYRTNDNSDPTIPVPNYFKGYKRINETIVIPATSAFDVYAPSLSATLSVYAPNGQIATDNDGVKLESVAIDKDYTLKLSSFGNYRIVYSIIKKDWINDNPIEKEYEISVLDTEAPEIIVSGSVKKTIKKGEAIVFPKFDVKDNYTAKENINVWIYISDASGRYVSIDGSYDSFVPVRTGSYRLIITAMDEAGNTSIVRYTINVTE